MHLTRPTKLLASLAVLLVCGLLTATPAAADHAEPGEHVLGHRCRTDARAASNENTVAALIDTAGMPGAVCEIDAWRIADGTVIVFHDGTWNRIADPATLPAGVGARDRVTAATWDQVRQIRTRGGRPVPTLQQMIDAAARYGIPLVVDIRNTLSDPAGLVGYANARGADVRYYQPVPNSCTTRHIDRFRAAGATVGVKLLSSCRPSPAQLQAWGVSFTQELSFLLTDPYLAEMDQRGIDVGVLDRGMTETLAESLVARGVDRVLLDRPREALTWFN